jgi:hypothetical protein
MVPWALQRGGRWVISTTHTGVTARKTTPSYISAGSEDPEDTREPMEDRGRNDQIGNCQMTLSFRPKMADFQLASDSSKVAVQWETRGFCIETMKREKSAENLETREWLHGYASREGKNPPRQEFGEIGT